MYVEKADRELLDPQPRMRAEDPGALAYQIISLVDEYLDGADISSSAVHEVVSVLECAKLEVYRRVVVPQRDHARLRNGDVLPLATRREVG